MQQRMSKGLGRAEHRDPLNLTIRELAARTEGTAAVSKGPASSKHAPRAPSVRESAAVPVLRGMGPLAEYYKRPSEVAELTIVQAPRARARRITPNRLIR